MKQVLDAIEALAATAKATKDDVAGVKSDLAGARIDAHRAETKKGFADLDEELTRHAAVHREIERDITALERRPPRTAARPPRRR